jgi:hypothetical protein
MFIYFSFALLCTMITRIIVSKIKCMFSMCAFTWRRMIETDVCVQRGIVIFVLLLRCRVLCLFDIDLITHKIYHFNDRKRKRKKDKKHNQTTIDIEMKT